MQSYMGEVGKGAAGIVCNAARERGYTVLEREGYLWIGSKDGRRK